MTIENARALQEQLANEAIIRQWKNESKELADDCIRSIAIVGKAWGIPADETAGRQARAQQEQTWHVTKPAAAWIEEGGALAFGDATFSQILLDAHKHRKDEAAFFQTTCVGHYASGTILYAWRQTLYCAGISYGGKGKGPRIHDLRHTFAVHCLQKWVEAGEDLNAKLPYLSAYMGHAGLYSTQQYLRLTAEAFPHIVSAMEHNFDVFPGRQVEL